MADHLNTADCRFLAFHLITGQIMARAATAARALDLAKSGGNDGDPSAIEVLDCGDEGRKIWLQNSGAGMPIFLHVARQRHPTVYRGDFYAAASWHGSQKPAVPLNAA